MSFAVLFRRFIVAVLTGFLLLGGAWAGVGLGPVSQTSEGLGLTGDTGPSGSQTQQFTAAAGGSGEAAALQPGQALVGASRVSIEPRPEDYDAVWERQSCGAAVGHATDLRSPLPVHPDCIYMWGVGPGTPVQGWDQDYGLWSRSVAFSDGEETIVLTMLDVFSYFAYYDRFCDGCGALDLAEELAEDLDFDPAGFYLASTHSHAAPDTIGSGGGVADWYMQQIADSIRASVTEAVQSMRPATIEIGEELARQFNTERRDTYYSAEDAGLAWLRAVDADDEVIATVGTYAAHPVTFGTNGRVAHPDWPGLFVKRVEDRFGGLGFFFQTGLGNMSATSPIGNRNQIGIHLANMLPEVGAGHQIADPSISLSRHVWDQPYTNIVIGALGASGVFDRRIGGPATIRVVGKSQATACVAASPASVRTVVSAARIGDLAITGSPGEVFSNLTNSIKEYSGATVAMPLAQINDGLGYIMQEFEAHYVYGQPMVIEYEETFGSQCFGDAVLEHTLALLRNLP